MIPAVQVMNNNNIIADRTAIIFPDRETAANIPFLTYVIIPGKPSVMLSAF